MSTVTGTRVYGTYLDVETDICHDITGIPKYTHFGSHQECRWDSNLMCGGWNCFEPDQDPTAIVNCLRCLWRRQRQVNPHDVLRGKITELLANPAPRVFDYENLSLLLSC